MENHNYPENRNSLPRRGFLRLLALGAGVGLLSACQRALETLVPTPSRTSSPSATSTVTLTPTSTSTPTLTRTPTETATQTPTFTPTETTTPTPTETLVPKIIFHDDFEHGLQYGSKNWGNAIKSAGSYEIIDDPTNSGKGKVLKCFPLGSPKLDNGEYRRRGYPDKYTGWAFPKNIKAPCYIGVDLYILDKFHSWIKNNWADVLSLFGSSASNKPAYIASVPIYKGKFQVLTSGGTFYDSGIKIEPNKWYDLKLVVKGSIISLFINGNEVINGIPYPKGNEIGMIGGHAGLYTSSGKNSTDNLTDDAYLLNDNFTIASSA